MGVKVENSINVNVSREALRAKVGKLDNFDSIFNRFDTDNDGNLSDSEQVGMMAFLNELAGSDGKLTKKDVKNADQAVMDQLGTDITYKDMKKFVKAYQNLLKKDTSKQQVTKAETQAEGADKPKTQYTAGNRTYTVDDKNRVATRNEGNVTTEYAYNNDNNISTQTESDKTKGAEKRTTSNYSYAGSAAAQELKTQTIEDAAAGTRTEITYTDTGRDLTITDKKTGVKTEEVYRGDDIQTRKVTDNRNNQTQVTTTQFKSYNGSRVADTSQTVTTTDKSKTTTDVTYSTDGTAKLFGKSKVEYTQNGAHNTVASLNGLGGDEGHIKEQNTTFNYNGDTQILTSSSIVFDDNSSENPHTMEQRFNSDGTIATTSVKNGKKSTEIKYSGGSATETVRDGNTNIDTTRTYSAFDSKTGRVSQDKKTQEVETNKNNHVRTTKTFTNGAQDPVTKYEQLDTLNSQVVMATEIDSANNTVKYSSGQQSITMQSADGKYTLVTAKWNDSKKQMETVREVATRLGYSGADLEKILEANGKGNADKPVKAGGSIKVPLELTLNKSFTALKAASEVSSEQQVSAYSAYQNYLKEKADLEAQLDETTKAARCGENYNKSADAAITNWAKKSTTRATFASDNYRVFCDQATTGTINGKKYQQHYIYSAYENKMVEIESVCKNIPAGQKVSFMTSTGYATLTNGKSLQLDLDDNKIHGKKYVGGYDPSSEKAKEIQARLKDLEKRYKDASKIMNTSAEQYVENVKNNKTFELAGTSEEPDSTRTQHLQGLTSSSQYASEDLKAKAHARYERQKQQQYFTNLQETANPFIFKNGVNYYVYYPESDGLGVESIDSIDSNGSVTSKGKVYTSDEFLLSIRIRHLAASYQNSQSTGYLSDAILSNITKDNVVGIWNAYKELGSDNDIMDTFTSENCTSGQGGGREKAVKSAKHIVRALLAKANDVPEIKDFAALKSAEEFLDDKLNYGVFTPSQYISGSGSDGILIKTSNQIIENLVKAINQKQDTQFVATQRPVTKTYEETKDEVLSYSSTGLMD